MVDINDEVMSSDTEESLEIVTNSINTEDGTEEKSVDDVEARRKKIEEFTMKQLGSSAIVDSEIPQEHQTIAPSEPKKAEFEPSFATEPEEIIPEPTREELTGVSEEEWPAFEALSKQKESVAPKKDPRRLYVLIALVFIVGGGFLFFTLSANKDIVSYNATETQEFNLDALQKSEDKEIPKRPDVYNQPGRQTNFGAGRKIEDMRASWSKKREVSSEIPGMIKYVKYEGDTVKDMNSGSRLGGNISSVWKIKEIKNSGAAVVVYMTSNIDREIEISVGDVVSDAGVIRSVRKTNGEWYVIGSKKVIAK